MAKLKIKQIEDLAILTDEGVKTIQIGEQIIPLTGVAAETSTDGYISGLTVDGNNLVITRTPVPVVNDGKLKVQFGTAAATDLFSANAKGDETLTLAEVANTGEAKDVAISAITGLTSTTLDVQTALEELAQKATDITVKGKDAIKVAAATGEGATGKVVSLVIDKSDNVLTQGADGLLANLSLDYDSTNKLIKLLGKTVGEGDDAAPVVIDTIDATDFIKDGMLESAAYVELVDGQVVGQDAGKYIVLTFNTTAGKDPIYVDVTALVDTYTAKANDWIELTGHEFSHKLTGEGAQTFVGTNDTTAQTPAFGGTVEISIPKIVVDAAGHVVKGSGTTTAKFTLPTPEAAKVYKQGYDYVTLDDSYSNADYEFNIPTGRKVEGTVVAYLNGQALIGVDLVETPDATVTQYDYEVVRVEGVITGVKFHYDLAKLGANLEDTDTVAISYVYYE